MVVCLRILFVLFHQQVYVVFGPFSPEYPECLTPSVRECACAVSSSKFSLNCFQLLDRVRWTNGPASGDPRLFLYGHNYFALPMNLIIHFIGTETLTLPRFC